MPEPYLDPNLPVAIRVQDLVGHMTLEEKVSQMMHTAPAIERLGVPEYNWWNECLHGVGRAGVATVFPQAIGLGATWDEELLFQVATAISDEARAKHHDALRNGNRGQYFGLTFWSPMINIFRDPRWGRGQESYGEDPYLTSRLAVSFVKGLQGDDPKYWKLTASAKHFAVHSGPEHSRHHFDARVSGHDLYATYLPAFEALVKEAKVACVMSAYNRTNGEACAASHTLLQEILREAWGFEGHVVSDCWAVDDIYLRHKVAETAAEAAAMSVKAGCDLECGCAYDALTEAVQQGLIDEPTLDRALKRLFEARFRLGMFDPPEMVPYAQIPISVNDCAEHRRLALQAARESIVLLKNEGGLLPLSKELKSVAVIGPNADDVEVLLGNYNGRPSEAVTPLEGIQRALFRAIVSEESHTPSSKEGREVSEARGPLPTRQLAESSPTSGPVARQASCVTYSKGCTIAGLGREGFEGALEAAKNAEVVVFFGGISQLIEGEEGQEEGLPEGMKSDGDRHDLGLPGVQEELLTKLHATGKPVVLVLLNGGPVSTPWALENLPAVLEAWYPGEEGGTAIADVLFGDYNPGGRLPVTVYRSVEDLPAFEDYRMEGHTYRYFRGEPLLPFGFGLSYTQFGYSDLKLTEGSTIDVSVVVRNAGKSAGDEVVQLYVQDVASSGPTPIWQLCGFARVHFGPGERKTVSFKVSRGQLSIVDMDGRRFYEPGEFRVAAGNCLPETRAFAGCMGTIRLG